MSPKPVVAIIGLGYVGTPLLAAFAEHYETLGYDVDSTRLQELRQEHDRTDELSATERARVAGLVLTDQPQDLQQADVYIVTVPTPIRPDKTPDLGPLEAACGLLGQLLKPGDTVVFESTVYPGATEEFCVPRLEQGSGLRGASDFWYGYSPERINPGDKDRRLQTITKVTSGCCDASAAFIDALYARVIPAGTYRASSVRVAEAAKVIENTQRDVNIALINELAMLFERLGLDTREVLAAAGTKWNFLTFQPGLVGGHCIGVDPYYLTHKAQSVGFEPNIMLAGRAVNDGMAPYVAGRVLGLMEARGLLQDQAPVLVLGLTFKENCPDTRNSQVIPLVETLEAAGCAVDVYDPWVAQDVARLITRPGPGRYHAIIGAVAHEQFTLLGDEQIRAWGIPGAVLFDIKDVFGANADARL